MRTQTIQVLTRALADKQSECDVMTDFAEQALVKLEGAEKQVQHERDKAKRAKASIMRYLVGPLRHELDHYKIMAGETVALRYDPDECKRCDAMPMKGNKP